MATYETDEIIIGNIIFILLAVFIAAAFIGYAISHRTPPINTIPVQVGAFLSSCTTTSCSTDLICDANSFVCKRPVNSPCNDFTDCAFGLICSGLCATGTTGNLNQLCPCNPGFLCTSESNGLTLCKGASGTSCITNADCASDLCTPNGCAGGLPNSAPCTTNSQCGSNNCNNGFCQNPGIITGTQGAACSGSCIAIVGGAICNSTPTVPLICQCSAPNQPGTCILPSQGILSLCSPITLCTNDLICFTPTANICQSGNTGCQCYFPYTDPNALAIPGGLCIGGMSSRNNICFNNLGFGCSSGNMCISSFCNNPSVLAVYNFTVSTPTGSLDLLTNYIGATSTFLNGVTGP